MKLSKLSIIMGALFASSLLFGNVQLFHNGMMDMQVAFSTGVSANGLPIASYKEIKYLISARYDNDLYVKVNLNLQPTAASPNFTDLVEYGYIQAGNWRVGKQIVPFGSYNSNIISHTFTREVERLLRQGVTYHMNYFDVFKVYFSLFNDSLNESMTAGALKMYVVPRKEIVFSQSVLFDQEYQTGTTIKQTKLDIHAMANLDFKEAVIDMEFYKNLVGNMDGGMLFNFAMKVVVYKDFNIVFHVEGADANAAAVVGKELYGAMGLNFNVKPGYDFSMEAGYLVNNSSSTEVKVLSQLSLQF